MSIFNRLITTLTGNEEAPKAVAPRSSVEKSERSSPRFMGREGADADAGIAVAVEDKGLEGLGMVWLHVQPATQHLLLVPGLGMADGEPLTGKMLDDLHRLGWCEEVAYHAGYDQYWKMPAQEAILRTPKLYDIPCPLPNRMQLETKLVKQGEPRGFWMRVRIRTEAELPPETV